MLTNMGVISFNYQETVSSLANGTGSTIGNYDLTSTYQTIYTKTGSAVYIENEYTIKVKENSNLQLQFLIEFTDDANGSGGADERVEGTIATVVVGILNGANFVRVHDVKENKRAITVTENILAAK